MNPISLFNPWVILGAVIALGVAGAAGFHVGDTYGIDNQKAVDQKQFDDINNKLTAQKTEANALYRAAQDHNVALMAERDKLKNDLETHYAEDQKTTDAHRRELAAASLRYPAAKSSGYRDCGSGTGSPGTNTADAPAPSVLQLPDSITSDLRQLTLDADNLKDAYRLCYDYANKMR